MHFQDRQQKIKFDLEISNLMTKNKLLEETLQNQSANFKRLAEYKDANKKFSKVCKNYEK